MPGPNDLQNAYLAYLNETDPGKMRAAYARLLAAQASRSPAVATPPVLAQTMSPAELVATAREGRYGTEADPLAMDPSTGMMSPMSVVRRNDTPVTPPPQQDPLGGLGAGSPAGPPQMVRLTTSSGSRTVHAPEFPKALLPKKQAIADEAIARAQDAAERKEILLGEQAAHAQLWADQARLESKLAGKAAGETYRRWEETGKELERGREAMRRTQLDPGRLWGQMPTAQKAVNAIGIALGGFVEGFTGGKVQNTALKMLNMAIDRDIAAQRDDFARQLEGMNLTAKAQGVLWQQWRAQEADRKAAALRVSQLELAKMGLQSQREDTKTKTAEVVLGIKDSLVNLEAKTIPKVSTTGSSTSRTVPLASLTKGSGAGKPPDATVRETHRKALGVLTKIEQLQRDLPNYSRLGRWNPNSKAADFIDDAKLLGKLYIKSEVGEALSGGEAVAAEGKLIRSVASSPEALARALENMKRTVVKNALVNLQSNASYFDVTPLAEQIRPYATQAAQGSARGFGRPQQ